MSDSSRFTDQAFEKVSDEKVIEEAKRRAEVLAAEVPAKVDDKKIS